MNAHRQINGSKQYVNTLHLFRIRQSDKTLANTWHWSCLTSGIRLRIFPPSSNNNCIRADNGSLESWVSLRDPLSALNYTQHTAPSHPRSMCRTAPPGNLACLFLRSLPFGRYLHPWRCPVGAFQVGMYGLVSGCMVVLSGTAAITSYAWFIITVSRSVGLLKMYFSLVLLRRTCEGKMLSRNAFNSNTFSISLWLRPCHKW